MTISYNVTGNARKKLVTALKHHLASDSDYLGAPTFAYEIGEYHLSQDGTLIGPDNRTMIIELCGRGFFANSEEYDTPAPYYNPDAPTSDTANDALDTTAEEDIPETSAFEELPLTEREELGLGRERRDPVGEDGPQPSDVPDPDLLTIQIPMSGFSPEAFDNLCKLVSSKEALIKKALDADDLPISVLDDNITFPWFFGNINAEHAAAYSQFITCLCKTAKEKKRVTAKPQESFENEKFAMRVWLIGLGLVGKEYSLARKLMMANLDGNSGHRYDSPDRTAAPAKIRIPTPIPNETAEQRAKRELTQLWANNDKRRAFIKSHREWGVWITVPELGLTYYKYELPDGGRILAMEYQRENQYPFSGEEGLQTYTTYYLWDGEYFAPHAASEYTIIERLKNLKSALQNELRSAAAEAPAPGAEPAPDDADEEAAGDE